MISTRSQGKLATFIVLGMLPALFPALAQNSGSRSEILAQRAVQIRLLAPGVDEPRIRDQLRQLLSIDRGGGQFGLAQELLKHAPTLPATRFLLSIFPHLKVGGRSAALLAAERAQSRSLCEALDSIAESMRRQPGLAVVHSYGLVTAMEACSCPVSDFAARTLVSMLWHPFYSPGRLSRVLSRALVRLASDTTRHEVLASLLKSEDELIAFTALMQLDPDRDASLVPVVKSRTWSQVIDRSIGCESFWVQPTKTAQQFVEGCSGAAPTPDESGPINYIDPAELPN